jgi:glutamate synthase (NADPH) small chain
LMWLANPDLARDVVRRRIEASATDYVTYCAVCRDFFASSGKRTLHLLDLVTGQDLDARATRPAPGWSQRHENRARLKRRLLREVWGEDMSDPAAHETIRLHIAAEVQARLDERLILVEDVQQVIEFAERTGAKLLNRESGHFLAGYKPSSVTYWVEYTPADVGGGSEHGFVVHNAYSHRMEIGQGAQP